MRVLLFVLSLLVVCGKSGLGYAENSMSDSHTVVLAYFQIGNYLDPAVSITEEQFQAHMNILAYEGYKVISLEQFLSGQANADKQVVLTFDHVDRTTLNVILPVLEQHNFPFTVFITPGLLDDRNEWEYVRNLRKDTNISVGIHPYDYRVEAGAVLRASLNRAIGRFEEELGHPPLYFSFPEGLYSLDDLDILDAYAFKAMFGQHSGAARLYIDKVYPRFTMISDYAGDTRFRMIASSLPLRVGDISPQESILTQTSNLGIGFTLLEDEKTDGLSCVSSEEGRLAYQQLGDKRIEIRSKLDRFARVRVNCLRVDEIDFEVRWRWLGFLLEGR